MVHPGRYDPARAGSYRAGAAGARYGRGGTAPGPQSRRRVLGADTSVTQLVLRLNYHPGHTRVVNAAFWHARNTTAGGRPGRSFAIREAAAWHACWSRWALGGRGGGARGAAADRD